MLDSSHINKIGFIGFGDFGKYLIEVFKIDLHPVIFEDNDNSDFKFQDYKKYLREYKWIICLGYKHGKLKKKIIEELINSNASFYDLEHNSSRIYEDIFGKGNIVLHNSLIDVNVFIGYGNIIHNNVTINHDSVIGNACYISPGVLICGNVKVGNNVFIGAGSIITNDIEIGDNVIIGAGSLINKNIEKNSNVIGNPFRIVSEINLT